MKTSLAACLACVFALSFTFNGCSEDDMDVNNNNNTNNNNNNNTTTYFIEATYRDSTYRFESTNPSTSYAPDGMECRILADPQDFYSGIYIEFVTPTEFTDADVLALKGKDIPYQTFDNYTETVVEIYIFTPESMSSAWCNDPDQANSTFHISDVTKISSFAGHDQYNVTGTFSCKVFSSPDEYPVTNGSFKLRLTRWPL